MVCVASFATVVARFDVLLSVVPGTTSVVKHGGEEQCCDRSEHHEPCEDGHCEETLASDAPDLYQANMVVMLKGSKGAMYIPL